VRGRSRRSSTRCQPLIHPSDRSLILGEFRRVLDDRYRLSIPAEWIDHWTSDRDGGAITDTGLRTELPPSMTAADIAPDDSIAAGVLESEKWDCVLAKERPGCLSLWRGGDWQAHLEAGIQVVQSKLQAGRLGDRLAQVQTLGRLLSTRQRSVQLAGRGRLLIPEGFREFLGVDPGTEVLVIGAAVCIEIWQPEAWRNCLNDEIPQFSQLLDELSG
jgi:MraZ protein